MRAAPVAVLLIIVAVASSLAQEGSSKSYFPIVTGSGPVPTPTPTLTPDPTLTPTPTSTLTPTLTPEPTATPTQAPGVTILNNHTHYVDSINYLNIVGEVANGTGDYLRFVRITGNVFNSAGQTVDTTFTFTRLDNLPPGERSCFRMSLPQPDDWAYYELESPTYWTDGSPLPNLTIMQHSGSYNAQFGWYEIVGMVRNDEPHEVRFVSPIATLYNAQGQVLGCDFTFTSDSDLAPGQSSSFKITSSGRDYADVASYRLQVDGR